MIRTDLHIFRKTAEPKDTLVFNYMLSMWHPVGTGLAWKGEKFPDSFHMVALYLLSAILFLDRELHLEFYIIIILLYKRLAYLFIIYLHKNKFMVFHSFGWNPTLQNFIVSNSRSGHWELFVDLCPFTIPWSCGWL